MSKLQDKMRLQSVGTANSGQRIPTRQQAVTMTWCFGLPSGATASRKCRRLGLILLLYCHLVATSLKIWKFRIGSHWSHPVTVATSSIRNCAIHEICVLMYNIHAGKPPGNLSDIVQLTSASHTSWCAIVFWDRQLSHTEDLRIKFGQRSFFLWTCFMEQLSSTSTIKCFRQ